MKIKTNTILITGGATGIGFALAKKFVALGNKVIICGRRENKLNDAKKKLPQIYTVRCDVTKKSDRNSLFELINMKYGGIDLLVNNAGIQRRIDLKKEMDSIRNEDDEFEINFKAQVYLSTMFVPELLKKESSAIINVSSGLGFVPLAIFPIYCATKAAIHSFTMSLRHQLKDTSIKVFEVIPPIVYDTELKGKPIEKTDWNVSADEVADAIIKGLENNEYEITIGSTKKWIRSSRDDLDKAFENINNG